MGNCLGGTGKINVIPASQQHMGQQPRQLYDNSTNSLTSSQMENLSSQNNGSVKTSQQQQQQQQQQQPQRRNNGQASNNHLKPSQSDNRLAVTNSSSHFVDGLNKQLNNGGGVMMNKNRRYFVFDRGDLIPKLHALHRNINSSNQTGSEGTEENSLNISNYQLFTKPKRNWSRYQQQLSSNSNPNGSSAASQRDELTTGSASRCMSPLSMTLSPSSPSDFYNYYHNGGGANGGMIGTGRSESRNTNTMASSPSSMDCVFLKVPSIPATPMDGLPPKRWDSTTLLTQANSTVDNRSEKGAASPQQLGFRNRSNTLDTVSSISNNPELFRSIKESTSVTRGFDDTGYMRLNQYLLKHEIGRGSYGVVKLAYNEQDNKHYAMKVLSKKRLFRRAALQARNPKFKKNPFDPMEKLHREIAILKKLNHPNVVKLVEVLDDPNEDNLYLVFELVAQGEVLSIPTENPLSEELSWKYFRDTVLGLEYLHFQKIIHRDLKPANLLLDDQGRVKIADFGVSNQFQGADASLSSCTGTPVFLAPELLEPDPILRSSRHISGRACDVWSLGVTLYCFLYGTVPWLENSNPALFRKIINEPLTFPEKPVVSKNVKDLISRMLDLDQASRYDLAKIKEHPWVTKDGLFPMPPLQQNCIQITVTDDEVNNAVKHVPKLATLILVKYMLQKGSFRNPFLTTSAIADGGRMSAGRRSRFSESHSPSRYTMMSRDRQAPSADLISYSPGDTSAFYQQHQHNNNMSSSSSCTMTLMNHQHHQQHQTGDQNNPPSLVHQPPGAIDHQLEMLMANAGIRRAFTRTNSVPMNLLVNSSTLSTGNQPQQIANAMAAKP